MGALLGLLVAIGVMVIWRSRDEAPAGAPRVRRWSERRFELISQAGLTGVRPGHTLAAQIGCGAAAFAIVALLTGAFAVAACLAAFASVAPVLVLRRLKRRRSAALRDVWPDVVDDLASSVRAGMSLADGVAAIGSHGPVELREAFARFGAEHRLGMRFGECLDRLKTELSDPVGDRVCETLRVARDVGGSDVGGVLRTLSELLRADTRARAEVETRQGWVVNAARLAVAAPWAVLLLLGTQSSALAAFDAPGGVILLAIGAGVCALAYAMMLRLGRLPDEQRVLR
jgi:tight adherence protein B